MVMKMPSARTQFLAWCLLFLLLGPSNAAVVKLGYWPAFNYWNYPAANVPSCLYTHLLYAFAVMNSSTFVVQPPDYDGGQMGSFVSTIRKKNSQVKALISIGGGGGDALAQSFSRMASRSSSRSTFISTSIALARQNGFDGLDIDWEYPGNATDMQNLCTLFQEWRAATAREAQQTGRKSLLLAAAVFYTNPLPQWLAPDSASYPLACINASLDWVLLMSYDMHGSWESSTGPPAPLYDPSSPTVNIDYGVTQWLKGLPAAKLLLGLPQYGYTWTLNNPANHGYGAPAVGTHTGLDDPIVYKDIVSFISSRRATVVHDQPTVSTYTYAGDAWIGYDDGWSVSGKVSYLKQKSLLGYGFWTASYDDSNFTLAKAAAKALDGVDCNGKSVLRRNLSPKK